MPKKKFKVTSEVTGTPVLEEVLATSLEVKKIDNLGVSFPSEDLNKVVAKINEIVDKLNAI